MGAREGQGRARGTVLVVYLKYKKARRTVPLDAPLDEKKEPKALF
jgi:hypothetical protein